MVRKRLIRSQRNIPQRLTKDGGRKEWVQRLRVLVKVKEVIIRRRALAAEFGDKCLQRRAVRLEEMVELSVRR